MIGQTGVCGGSVRWLLVPAHEAKGRKEVKMETRECARGGVFPGVSGFLGWMRIWLTSFYYPGCCPLESFSPISSPRPTGAGPRVARFWGPEPFLSRPEASQMLILGSYPRPPGARFSRSGAAALPCPWPGKCAVALRLGSRSGGGNPVAGGGGERFLFMTFFLRESRASRRRSHLWPSIGIEIFPDASRKTIRTRKATRTHTHILPPPWTQRAEPGPSSLPVASAALTSR